MLRCGRRRESDIRRYAILDASIDYKWEGIMEAINWEAISAVSEAFGVIAIVISLVFVGFQIRQNSNSVRMSAEMDVSKQFAGWASLVVNNPNVGRIWDAAADDPGSLSDEDIRQFLWFVMELLLLYEAQFHMYLKGHISEESWDAKANMFLGLIRNPIVGKWWDTGLGPFSSHFREYIEDNRGRKDLKWEYASVSAAGRLDT